MDVSLLASIVKLMQENDLNTVELRDGEKRVMLSRGPGGAVVPGPMHYAAPAGHSAPPAASAAAEESEKFLARTSPNTRGSRARWWGRFIRRRVRMRSRL